MENKNKEFYTIDALHIIRSLRKGLWVIILCAVLVAAAGFSISAFVITPTYSSSIMLYVNNSSITVGGMDFSISASEITAAQSLVKTYSEILMNRTTLERVIDNAGVEYDYKDLYNKIEATSSNGTEIMKVTVTTDDPYKSARIANSIAEELPTRVAEIIDGASMEVVDSAIPVLEKVEPSITKYTAIGLMLGALLSTIVLIIVALMDGTIHDEEYVLHNYNCPILAKVPNLVNSGGKHYSYYYQSKSKE